MKVCVGVVLRQHLRAALYTEKHVGLLQLILILGALFRESQTAQLAMLQGRNPLSFHSKKEDLQSLPEAKSLVVPICLLSSY